MKCKKCKQELELRGFERYKAGEEKDIYACQTKGCALNGKKIPHGLPTTTIKEGN